jgi:hypothetical protein
MEQAIRRRRVDEDYYSGSSRASAGGIVLAGIVLFALALRIAFFFGFG